MVDTVREHRASATAWVLAISLANFVMVLSIDRELEEFPGGGEALARVLGPSVEAFRPLRWPAERLDTLGGYFTYHNATLVGLFFALYGVVLGAKAVRLLEEEHRMGLLLATGVSRVRLVVYRSVGFAILLGMVWVGISLGTAAAFAIAGEPDTGGAFVTFLGSATAALMCFGFGLLLSQFTKNAAVAWGIGSVTLLGLYVLGNSAGTLGAFGWVEAASPFTYVNLSRALVPGHEAHWVSMIGMLLAAAAAVAAAAVAFRHRDVGAPFGARARAGTRMRPRRHRRTVRSLWADGLHRGWVAIVAWAAGAAALTGVMIALEPSVIDAWEMFGFMLPGVAGGGEGDLVAEYLAVTASFLIPLVAGYVVSRASRWIDDFSSGRVGLLLASPVSWTRIVLTRIGVTMLGTAAITGAAIAAITVGAGLIGIEADPQGLLRLAVTALALGLAMSALAAITTAVFRRKGAVVVLGVYVGASYLLTFVVPMLGWPDWVNRLSVFFAFGNPYLEWPALDESVAILLLAGPGLVLAVLLTSRSPKLP